MQNGQSDFSSLKGYINSDNYSVMWQAEKYLRMHNMSKFWGRWNINWEYNSGVLFLSAKNRKVCLGYKFTKTGQLETENM